MQIDGQTKIVGLIGDPINHSLSPAMHNAAYQALALNYLYLPFRVPAASLAAVISAVRCLDFRGLNVTVPHKETVIPQLDFLDRSAKRCGAVNTIVNNSGILTGYNTDGDGFIDSLQEYGFESNGKKAVVLGAGGSARAIASALQEQGISKIVLINRTMQKAQQMAEALGAQNFRIFSLSSVPADALAGAQLVINTLAVPFRRDDGGWLLDLSAAAGALFYDLRYGKMLSDFLVYANELKSPGLDGLGMLLHQGARAFQLFTGEEPPVEIMRKACLSKEISA
ncbi:MAG: Shikimate dehydrogenase (NADP(+)) [Syntrophomonadaceae bacterium]|nr:Shikimate dehydrogenase (NADP(+)) [Bacillota bacterium]